MEMGPGTSSESMVSHRDTTGVPMNAAVNSLCSLRLCCGGVLGIQEIL